MGLILVSFVDPGEQNRGAQAFVLVSGWGGGVSSETNFSFFSSNDAQLPFGVKKTTHCNILFYNPPSLPRKQGGEGGGRGY